MKKQYLTPREKYLLTAIYGPDWAQMKDQYLAKAIANVQEMIKHAKARRAS